MFYCRSIYITIYAYVTESFMELEHNSLGLAISKRKDSILDNLGPAGIVVDLLFPAHP